MHELARHPQPQRNQEVVWSGEALQVIAFALARLGRRLGRLSFSPGGGWGLVAQPHGGALKSGGTLEGSSRGGWLAAERRRARAERDEAIDDAVAGHIEKLSTIMGQLVEEAGGEQYRCPQCGSFGPKVSDH